MNNLIEYCLLEILEYLSLKDRTTCRLVSKKFKLLCDSIKINSKLVIFNRIPETKGKLKYTDEVYTLDDTIYVKDLGKFLKAHYRNLKNIKKLVIIGVNQEQFGSLRKLSMTNKKIAKLVPFMINN